MLTWEQHHLQTNPCLESHLAVTAFAAAAAAAHATAAAGDGCCARFAAAAALVAPAALTAALGHKTEQSFQGRLQQARGTATADECALPQHLTWLSCTKGVHAGQLQCSRSSLDCIIALKVADATERLQQSTCFDRSARTLCQEHALQIHSHSQHIPGQSAACAGPPSVATIHSCSPSTAQLLHHTSLQCVCCTAASMRFDTPHVRLTQHAQLREGHPKHGVHLQGSAVELSCPAWPPCQPVDAPKQVPSCSSIGHLHAAHAASTHAICHA